MTIKVLVQNLDTNPAHVIEVFQVARGRPSTEESLGYRLEPGESQEFHVWSTSDLIIQEVVPD
jgi:hypothetical protein